MKRVVLLSMVGFIVSFKLFQPKKFICLNQMLSSNLLKITIVTFLFIFLFFESKSQVNFDCECEEQEAEDIYCLLENAGYIAVEAIITSGNPYYNNCPCDNFPAFTNDDNAKLSSTGTTVEIKGKEFIIEDVFEDYELYFNGTTNINMYNLLEFCPDINLVLNGPGNIADFNLNVVLIDHEGDACDLLYYKAVFDDPCGSGFINIDRFQFPVPTYTYPDTSVPRFKPGDGIYYSYIDNKFEIASAPPNINYTLLESNALVFEINSYISNAYDGPPALWQICGEKLISYIEIIPTYYPGLPEEYGYRIRSSYKVGETGGLYALEGRHYFEELQNIALDEEFVADFSGCFEQHVSVPLFEEFALYVLGYDIVNVAQKAQIEIEGKKIEVKFLTDVFPSADFILYGEGPFFGPGQNSRTLETYDQPSFVATHGFYFIPLCPDAVGVGVSCMTGNISRRPDPMFYCRFPE